MPPRLLAVTVLTSLDEDDLAQQGVAGPARAQVVRDFAKALGMTEVAFERHGTDAVLDHVFARGCAELCGIGVAGGDNDGDVRCAGGAGCVTHVHTYVIDPVSGVPPSDSPAHAFRKLQETTFGCLFHSLQSNPRGVLFFGDPLISRG